MPPSPPTTASRSSTGRCGAHRTSPATSSPEGWPGRPRPWRWPPTSRVARACRRSRRPAPPSGGLRGRHGLGRRPEVHGPAAARAAGGPSGGADAAIHLIRQGRTTVTDVREVRNDDATDVVEFLMNQHQQVRGLLDDVPSAAAPERQQYFDTVREMLARHETAEEMIVRPLTRTAPGGEEVAQGRMDEENEAKEVLATLEKMDVTSAEFTARFSEFRQSVLDHAEAEETQEFPLLRQNTDAEALQQARDRVKRAEAMAPTHPHPSAKTTTMNYVAGPFAAMLDRARDAFSKSG